MKPGRKATKTDVSIGKFDILATYTYVKARLDGLHEDDAKERGFVAAVMGAQARLGTGQKPDDRFKTRKDAAEKKNKDDDHRRVIRPSGR